YANRDPVARHHLDSEAAHPAAQLGQYFVAGVALHTVKSAAVYRHDSTLHINKIVLAQLLAFLSLNKHYAIVLAGPRSLMRSTRYQFAGLEPSHGVLDLLRKRFVIVTGEAQRDAECDTDPTGPRHECAWWKHAIQTLDADRHDRHVEARSHHTDAGPKA